MAHFKLPDKSLNIWRSLAARTLLISLGLIVLPLVIHSLFVYYMLGPAEALFHFSTFLVVLVVIGGGAALWLTRRMARPESNLYSVMERVSMGDLAARYESDSLGFEINHLGSRFNQTVEQLITHKKNEEALGKELSVAREIQKNLLPQDLPKLPSLEVDAIFLPALSVGGDFYDMLHSDGKLLIAIGDCSGKGLPACLYSLGVRSTLRSLFLAGLSLEKAISEVNHLLILDVKESGNFLTGWFATFDPIKNELTYLSCGHPPGFLIRKGGKLEELSTNGIALALTESPGYTVSTLTLHKGDQLFLYTDGIEEAHNSKGELFGKERMLTSLQESKSLEVLLRDVAAFAEGAQQHDDITALSLKVR